MSDNNEVGELIRQLITPEPGQRLLGSTNVDAARGVLRRFEQRARELDGDQAPVGIAALAARYYPPSLGAPPSRAGMNNLRRTIKSLLEL